MLKLDAEKIEVRMVNLRLTPADLAKRLGETRAATHYLLLRIKGGSQTQAGMAAKLCRALGLKTVRPILASKAESKSKAA
jgi:hypothetical protein